MLIASSLLLARMQGIVLLICFCSGCLMMSNTVTIFCLVQGHSAEQAFPVHISKSSFVGDLKDSIKERMSPEFDNLTANSLELWKVNIPSEETAIQQFVLEENRVSVQKLNSTIEIEEYFPAPARRHIHIMVKPPTCKCHFPLPLTQLIH
jgi:hypothetical protein